MGTRNLTCVWVDGDFKVAQYGQWDGYPTSAGAEIASAVQDIVNAGGLETFADIVRGCRFITEDELAAKYADLGIEGEWITMEDASRFKELYPQIDRDMGYGIVRWLWENGSAELTNNVGFAGDTLFCEWAYVVDLDECALEVYCGYFGSNGQGRLGEMEGGEDAVALLKTIPFEELCASDPDVLGEELERMANEED